MLNAILALAALAGGCGVLLGVAAARLRPGGDPVAERIDALLPQTQCGQCGYPGCRPYAQAIAAGQAPINQCPPGGAATIQALAALLAREPLALDPRLEPPGAPQVAYIHEEACIGCTLCIQACPVDAIVGASQRMHTVIAAECTGCDLCVAPCPVDCIDLVRAPDPAAHWRWPAPGATP